MKQSLIAHACNCFTNAWVPLSKSVGAMATYFRLRWERHLIYTKGQLQFYGRLKACIFREIFSSLFNMHLSKVNYYNQTLQYYSAFKSTMFAGNISQHQILSRWSINGQCFPLPKYARIRSEEEWWVLLILYNTFMKNIDTCVSMYYMDDVANCDD